MERVRQFFNSWIDKKNSVKSQHFPEPKTFWRKIKVELDLSNCATKADLKNAIGVDTSKFDKKVDLVSLKSNVGKLDIDKLKNVPINLNNLKMKVDKLDFDKLVLAPVDLNKVSDAVKNHVVTKDVCNAKIKNIKNKIPDITNLATTTALNSKINEVEKYLILLTLLILILLILLLFLLKTKYLMLVI